MAVSGRCPACRHQVRLLKDGRLGIHVAKPPSGGVAVHCPGAGEVPVPLIFDTERGLPDCGECAAYMVSAPMLGEAIYSVSIESGGDPQAMLRALLTRYHVSGHGEL